MTPCTQCQQRPEMVNELLNVYAKGNPIRGIHILTETMAHDANLHEADRNELAEIIHLLAEVAQQRNTDRCEEIQLLKIPA